MTTDDNLGALYRHGEIPGPLDPGETPPQGTSLAFVAGSGPPPISNPVRYGASFSVKVDLNPIGTGSCSVNERLVRVGLGGAGIPAKTDGAGIAEVFLRASLSPGTYVVAATFAGDATCASSDVSAQIRVEPQPTQLQLAFPVATLTATTSPATPLHLRNVTFVLKRTATNAYTVYTGKTDPLGKVELPQSLIQSLPGRDIHRRRVLQRSHHSERVVVLAPDDATTARSHPPTVTGSGPSTSSGSRVRPH